MATVYLDAVLEPPRSLSPRGFNRVMLFFGVMSLIPAVTFYAMGAWPIVGFMGLEVLAVWAVFKLNFRSQTARTCVRVTADAVDVRKVDGWGRERSARIPAYFARVEFDRTSPAPTSLRLTTSAHAYPLGEHLTPRERETFARRLSQAISDARRERYTRDQDWQDHP